MVAVVLATAMASGCAGAPLRGDWPTVTQAHAVAVMPLGKLARVRWISVLPEQGDMPVCERQRHTREMLTVRACVGITPEPWLAILEQAQQAMQAWLPDWQPSRWELDLTRGGPARTLQYVRWRRGDQVPLRLAFVAGDDPMQSQRSAVRSLAHETFHVLEAARRVRPDAGSEYRATLAGSCIELATFGSLVVQQWHDPAAVLAAATLPPAQQASLTGYLQAAATVARHFDADGGQSEGLVADCRAVLDGRVAAQAASMLP